MGFLDGMLIIKGCGKKEKEVRIVVLTGYQALRQSFPDFRQANFELPVQTHFPGGWRR